ncbi:hypothetical protein [uncultured Gelidibacter sp.]|uniref:hypothetical protein n=1 Tax=uncultured Gelidibacter sp. TaxID=259318 RepID=UPI00263167E7|nr:hypothetical protein [uncultured Gelidibacter sp.]
MTSNFRKWIKTAALLLFTILVSTSCEKENDITLDSENQELNFTVIHNNFSFIKKNALLFNKLNTLSAQKNKKGVYVSKGEILETDDFTIFKDRVTYIAAPNGTKESYSFYIERPHESEANIIENLILSKKTSDTEYSAYLITYLFPDGLNNEENSFEVIGFQEIDIESVSGLYANRCEESYEYNFVEIKHDCYTGEHSGAGQAGSCNYETAGGNPPYSTWIVQATPTTTCDGESGGGGTTGGQTDTGGPNASNPPYGGNDGVDTGITLPPNCQTNDCGEDIIANDINDLLDSTLSYNQLLWLFENDTEANIIKSFLGNNPNMEMKAFALASIESWYNGYQVNFDEYEVTSYINNIENPITGNPIELYLIAKYKSNALLDLSLYSIGTNQIQIGEYNLTPHYGINDKLVFYSALRTNNLGIEYVIKANALSDFQDKITIYTAAANLVYLNGIPSEGQIAIAAGDYFSGLKDMWADALTNPNYYIYLAHIFVATATNLNAANSSSTTYASDKINYSNITNPNSVPNYAINNRSFNQYKDLIQQKYNIPWQNTSSPNVKFLINGNIKYNARTVASDWSYGYTIDYYRNGILIGKLRFYN